MEKWNEKLHENDFLYHMNALNDNQWKLYKMPCKNTAIFSQTDDSFYHVHVAKSF